MNEPWNNWNNCRNSTLGKREKKKKEVKTESEITSGKMSVNVHSLDGEPWCCVKVWFLSHTCPPAPLAVQNKPANLTQVFSESFPLLAVAMLLILSLQQLKN